MKARTCRQGVNQARLAQLLIIEIPWSAGSRLLLTIREAHADSGNEE
jgi:hypothetical protein